MSVAYSGLVKMHAAEIALLPAFRRTGRPPSSAIHEIARDLDKLDRPHPLDETIDRVLLEAEARVLATNHKFPCG